MTDTLRTRIAAVYEDHTIRLDYSHPRFGDCRCGFQTGAQDRDGEDFDEWWWERHAAHVADAVIRELTDAIPPIVATAIRGYAQSELAAMSYHGASKDAFEVMEKMNREALQIAKYATTHEDWNG